MKSRFLDRVLDEEATIYLRQEAKDNARFKLQLARRYRGYKGYHALLNGAHYSLEVARTAKAYIIHSHD